MAPDWTVAAWSAAAARITALPADRVVGGSIWIAFPAAKGTELELVLVDVLADGKPRTFLAPAGTPEVAGTVLEIRITRGPENHLVLCFRPVHEELAPESRAAQLLSALEAERRLYLQLFSSLPTPALVLTRDGQILDANPEGAKLLGGADAAALRGRLLSEWAPSPQQGALAAALRHAVTRRQDVALAFEFAGERSARRRRERRSGARVAQAPLPGAGRVARDAVAAAVAPGRPVVAARGPGVRCGARVEQSTGRDRGLRGSARAGPSSGRSGGKRRGDPERGDAGRSDRPNAARLCPPTAADADRRRSRRDRRAGARAAAQRTQEGAHPHDRLRRERRPRRRRRPTGAPAGHAQRRRQRPTGDRNHGSPRPDRHRRAIE